MAGVERLKQEVKKPYVAAIVAAAGAATRMNGLDKQFEEIDAVPVIVWSLRALSESNWIDEIIVVARGGDIPDVLTLIRAYGILKVRSVVAGGDTRQRSVALGLAAVSGAADYVAVHDGARPLVSQQVIADTVLDALYYGAAAAAVPVTDTVKIADAERMIIQTPDRASLYAVQTPQVFALDRYREAAAAAEAAGLDYTDDCQMLEAIGQRVYLSHGARENLKITTPIDLLLAQAIAQDREGLL